MWGASTRPPKYTRTARSMHLVDDGFAGHGPADAPDDLEVEYRNNAGERRFLRYVDGKLVDAWLMRNGPIDDSYFAAHGREQFRGAGRTGRRCRVAVSDAISWEVDGRTVLHWRDRLTDTKVLANRAVPGGRYSARRPEVLAPGAESAAKMVSGELARQALCQRCRGVLTIHQATARQGRPQV